MSREIKKPSLIGKLKPSNRNKLPTNGHRLAEISQDKFLDIPNASSDRSSTGSYTASCFASPLGSRKFKKPEVERLQKFRIENYYQEELGSDVENRNDANDSETLSSKKMRRSNTVELNVQGMNSKTEKLKKSILQRSHSFLSKLGSKSPKKKQNDKEVKSPTNTKSANKADGNKRLLMELGVDWGQREIRESLSRALEGGQVCLSEGPSTSTTNCVEPGWKKPAQFFPSFSSNIPTAMNNVVPQQQQQHPAQTIHLRYDTRLSDISEESHVSDGLRMSNHSTRQENPCLPSAGTAFHLQGGGSEDLVRRKVQQKLIPPRPSSVVPSMKNDSTELNYFLAPSNHAMNKSHSATQIRPNFYSEEINRCRMSRSTQVTSDHQSMRLQNEASSRMSSYTSDLESASPASSGVGSCKELRTVLPLVRSPNRSMERPLGQVFLTYNEETKKSQLPNEVTSMDTVKALFVRAFPKNLNMQWFDNPLKKIYILDRITSVYYEVDDLREINDRSQLKIYELDSFLLSPSKLNNNINNSISNNNINNNSLPHETSCVDVEERSNGANQRHSVPCFEKCRLGNSVELNTGNQLNGILSSPPERERMRKMEAQLANLSALVESLSTKQNVQPVKHDPSTSNSITSSSNNCASDNPAKNSSTKPSPSSSTTTSRMNQSRYLGLSKKMRDLRKELHQIRDLQVSFMNSIRLSLQHLMRNCKNSSARGLTFENMSDIRCWVERYKKESFETGNGLRDLEFLVEELRCDVINRKCKVNSEEIEGFAMCLSYLSKSLANLKTEFPRLLEGTKKVVSEEMDMITAEGKFLSEEPSRLEKSLRQTKKLMSVLYTLKKLSTLQGNQKIEVPVIEAKVELADVDRKILLANIESIQPDHDMRAIKMEKSLRARELRRKIQRKVEKMKFENQLRGGHKSLRPTNNFEINHQRFQNMLVLLYQQQLANGGKRLSCDAHEEPQKDLAPQEVLTTQTSPSPDAADERIDGFEADSHFKLLGSSQNSGKMNGDVVHVQPASGIKQSQLARFRAIHEITSPPIKRSGAKHSTPTKRALEGVVASEIDSTSFEPAFSVDESESEESCCSISTIKRAAKVKDHQSRSSVVSVDSSPVAVGSNRAGPSSPLVLTPPSTIASTLVAIPPSNGIRNASSNSTSTFTKPSPIQTRPSSIPSRQCPPPVPMRKTSILSKNAPVFASPPLYSNLQEMRTNKGSTRRRQEDDLDADEPKVKETHFGTSDCDVDVVDDVVDVKKQKCSTTTNNNSNNPEDIHRKTYAPNNGRNATSHLRRPPLSSSSKVETSKRRPSPISQQEGILLRSSQKVTGSKSSKNVKFKPDGNKCEETEIN